MIKHNHSSQMMYTVEFKSFFRVIIHDKRSIAKQIGLINQTSCIRKRSTSLIIRGALSKIYPVSRLDYIV